MNCKRRRGLALGALAALAIATTLTVALVAPARSAGQAGEDAEWPTVNGTLDGQRYSPLAQIDTSNVKGLKVAWRFRVPKTLGSENYPVIVGHTAYVTTSFGNIYALDASTGKQLWTASAGKQKNIGLAAFAAVHGFPNRGVAVGDGRVYGVTPNALLLAFDQTNGKLQWKTSIGNPVYLSESAAPIFYNGMVFVGSAGGESGQRGFEAAYDAKTGHQIWRHFTVPAPDTAGSYFKNGHHGGGDIWMNPTIDPQTSRLYVATGNPGSDLDPRVRLGRDLWTNSIVALDAKTGKQLWGYQLEHHDVWDLDSASPPVMFSTKSGLAVGEANKGGFWHEVDAATGKRLTTRSRSSTSTESSRSRADRPSSRGRATGGSEWSPVPFSPQTGLVYISGVNAPSLNKVPKKAPNYKTGVDLGGTAQATGPFLKKYPLAGTGTFTAVDVDTGKISWQKKEPVAMIGGAIVTAGGLVFVGVSGKGLFQALDAKTGQVLWQHGLGARIDDAASVYSVGGKEYVLIASGGTSIGGPGWGGIEKPSPATFTAYSLG